MESNQAAEPQTEPEVQRTGIEALPESWQSEIKALRKEAEKYRLEKKQALEAQEAERRKALEEQGQFKVLYENLTKELDAHKSKLSETETNYQKIIEARKSELLSRLPADKAKNYESFTVDQLEIIAKDFSYQNQTSLGAEAGGKGGTIFPERFEDMTDAQMAELVKHPDLLNELVQKQFRGT